jgi:4-amino-4-deoxy-L-arabinose transferase-like glycosyltransferase
MKSYPKYLMTDLVAVCTLILIAIGSFALTTDDPDGPPKSFWVGWIITWVVVNVGYYLYRLYRHNKGL